MIFRKAVKSDVPKAFGIYEKILDEEEKGNVSIGWKRGGISNRSYSFERF